MRAQNGQRKLVVIDVVASHPFHSLPAIAAHIITPGSLNTSPMVARQLFNFGPIGDTWDRRGLRIYPAHITAHADSKCEAVFSYVIATPETGGEKVIEEL